MSQSLFVAVGCGWKGSLAGLFRSWRVLRRWFRNSLSQVLLNVLRSATANQVIPVELRYDCNQKFSGNAIPPCVGDARLSCLETVFCSALLGKSPLVEALFANLAINKMLEAIFNLVLRE